MVYATPFKPRSSYHAGDGTLRACRRAVGEKSWFEDKGRLLVPSNSHPIMRGAAPSNSADFFAIWKKVRKVS